MVGLSSNMFILMSDLEISLCPGGNRKVRRSLNYFSEMFVFSSVIPKLFLLPRHNSTHDV